jgi:hypothetical protein
LGFFVGQRKVCCVVSVVRDLMLMSISGGFCVRYFEWVISRKLWVIYILMDILLHEYMHNTHI